MTTSMLACGKANACGSLKSTTAFRLRQYSVSTFLAQNSKYNGRGEDATVQRELFVNVLTANATKRDAKQYLARFKPPKEVSAVAQNSDVSGTQKERTTSRRLNRDRLDHAGVSIGGLDPPTRAIADSPQFIRDENVHAPVGLVREEQLHVALVSLNAPESVNDATLDGLAVTIAQLGKLDMRIVLVLGPELPTKSSRHRVGSPTHAGSFVDSLDPAKRVCDAINRHNPEGSRHVTGALELSAETDSEVNLALPKTILEPLKRGVVPVIPSFAHTNSGQLRQIPLARVITALTRSLSGLEGGNHSPTSITTLPKISLDRIIILDNIGGIPSKDRGDDAHVFINLEQEFTDIIKELSDYASAASEASLNTSGRYAEHQHNLDMARRSLALLPSASSALIITPHEAASSSQANDEHEPTIGAGTRRQKNTLIHNLLTNKPVVSSSLPAARLPNGHAHSAPGNACTATLVKRGMPLTIVPAATRGHGWALPPGGRSPLQLEDDPRVDFPRLLHLIEDSFRRKLDVRHYLDRIRDRIAGIIVAGEYEGGAILTWEMPPDGPPDPARLVPYLDKFAVLQSSQGSSGVADIVFQAMVRTCFPHGVCWRSRKDNPVNKWYFERASGSWQIPESNWTMFWTGDGVVENEARWNDYVSVCRNVLPSWSDGKKPD